MVSTRNNPFDGDNPNYRGLVSQYPWSLCIGAGISFGLVPTWQELTRRVINDAFETTYDDDGFSELVKNTGWSLDSLLQGAATRLGLQGESSEAFANLLEKHIYGDFLKKADLAGVKAYVIEALNNPRL